MALVFLFSREGLFLDSLPFFLLSRQGIFFAYRVAPLYVALEEVVCSSDPFFLPYRRGFDFLRTFLPFRKCPLSLLLTFPCLVCSPNVVATDSFFQISDRVYFQASRRFLTGFFYLVGVVNANRQESPSPYTELVGR